MTDVTRHADSDLVRAIEEHAARNKALLAQLLELGTSLSDPHVIDCQFRAPTREAAGHLVEKLVERGFTDLATVPGASDRPWGVEGRLHEAPEFVASPEITEEFLRLAATCSATYDGWRPSVDEGTNGKADRIIQTMLREAPGPSESGSTLELDAVDQQSFTPRGGSGLAVGVPGPGKARRGGTGLD